MAYYVMPLGRISFMIHRSMPTSLVGEWWTGTGWHPNRYYATHYVGQEYAEEALPRAANYRINEFARSLGTGTVQPDLDMAIAFHDKDEYDEIHDLLKRSNLNFVAAANPLTYDVIMRRYIPGQDVLCIRVMPGRFFGLAMQNHLTWGHIEYYKLHGYEIWNVKDILALLPTATLSCSCSLQALMAEGCKCGGK